MWNKLASMPCSASIRLKGLLPARCHLCSQDANRTPSASHARLYACLLLPPLYLWSSACCACSACGSWGCCLLLPASGCAAGTSGAMVTTAAGGAAAAEGGGGSWRAGVGLKVLYRARRGPRRLLKAAGARGGAGRLLTAASLHRVWLAQAAEETQRNSRELLNMARPLGSCPVAARLPGAKAHGQGQTAQARMVLLAGALPEVRCLYLPVSKSMRAICRCWAPPQSKQSGPWAGASMPILSHRARSTRRVLQGGLVNTAERMSNHNINSAVQSKWKQGTNCRLALPQPSPARGHKPKLQAAPCLVKRLLRQHLQNTWRWWKRKRVTEACRQCVNA